MQQIVLDTNIIIDIALEREPFNNDALKLFSAIKDAQINAFITANSITDIYYILNKSFRNKGTTINYLKFLLDVVGILDTDSNIILDALYSD
jgi:predicted nucleic acid-binding protein